jgi:hypothetical protein
VTRTRLLEHGTRLILEPKLADQNPTFRARLQELFRRWCGRVEECLQDARQAGQLSPDLDIMLLAEFCVNSWEGAILRMKASKSIDPPVANPPTKAPMRRRPLARVRTTMTSNAAKYTLIDK